MLSKLQRPNHRAYVNWAPLSDVMVAVRGQAAPAQQGVPCAAAWLVLYLPVSWLL